MSPTTSEVTDKHGEPIHIGDEVSSRARGGKQTGKVKQIIVDEKEARDLGVGHAPKVVYDDQHGHRVSHKPGTVVHGENPKD